MRSPPTMVVLVGTGFLINGFKDKHVFRCFPDKPRSSSAMAINRCVLDWLGGMF